MLNRFAIVLLIFAGALFAENADVWQSPVKANAPELQNVMKAVSAPETIRGTFKQTRNIVKISRKFESTGTFEISKTKGITWNIEKPFASSLVITDSNLVQTNSDGSKTEMSATDNVIFSEIAKSMRAVLGGNLSVLEERFEIYFAQGKKSWSVGLVPREKTIQKAISKMTLEGNRSLEKVELVDGEGNILTYEFRESAK